jgi:hypothetical protein
LQNEEADDLDDDQTEDTVLTGGLVRLIPTGGDGGWGSKVRADLTNALLQFGRKHAKAENPDVATLKQALKLMDAFRTLPLRHMHA